MTIALQTKLSKEQKADLKAWRKNSHAMKNALFYQDAYDSPYTVMVSPACEGISVHTSDYVRVAVATQGCSENKFKAKAGLLYAASRMTLGEYITIRGCDLVDLLFVFSLGNAVAQPFAK